MEPMLSLETPFLLVKPNLFCSTPAIFKALDLDSRSTADPLQLLKKLTDGASARYSSRAPAHNLSPGSPSLVPGVSPL
jgi:4-diphosphocytidyl-2C-methyl-D-erythritol kinase